MSPRQSDQVFATDRSCTDILALIVLIGLVIGFGFLLSVVVQKGDIYRVINGYDDCANVCGRVTSSESNPEFACKGADKTKERSGDLDDRTVNSFIPVYVPADYHEHERRSENAKLRDQMRRSVSIPLLRSAPYFHRLQKRETGTITFRFIRRDIVFLNRCVPKETAETATSLLRKLGLENFYKKQISLFSGSLQGSRRCVEGASLLIADRFRYLPRALAFSLGILIAFRYMVQWVVYIVLIGAILASIAGSVYLWLAWYAEKKGVEMHEIPEEDSSEQAYLVYAIMLTIVTVVTLLIVLVMRKRIALVMQLFREAGKAVYAMPALLLQPIYTYLLIGSIVCAWVYCMLWIESAGNIYKNRKNHIHFRKDAVTIVSRWYNLFFFFVTCEFLLGCQHMVVACAVARWFFTRDKKHLSLPIAGGFGYLIRYHLGTVAFGALVIGIIRLIRAVISFVQNRLKHYDNDLVRVILWCCHCCIWCFECALKFLTRNAYIETAIYGCNFCTGGRKAFQALSSNILRVAAINSVGDFVLFLGKVMVVTLTVVSGIYLIQKKEGLHYPWIPIALAGVFAFLVAHCFISIYEMIIDTIFICFCEDCEKNDGINRPYFMSRGLMVINIF
ncbi:hypothetical protein E2986_03005 [Frieseomelitta varia]|uniref:Choline transporter-like protein n=1 Tax=Frieseomelitta varia TaxID=561572 RepID=A0A833S6A9_9HYME|nr:hypothetical protein E2986_03005 [Frieseomelitta varia]